MPPVLRHPRHAGESRRRDAHGRQTRTIVQRTVDDECPRALGAVVEDNLFHDAGREVAQGLNDGAVLGLPTPTDPTIADQIGARLLTRVILFGIAVHRREVGHDVGQVNHGLALHWTASSRTISTR
jgi:hypothetical protein